MVWYINWKIPILRISGQTTSHCNFLEHTVFQKKSRPSLTRITGDQIPSDIAMKIATYKFIVSFPDNNMVIFHSKLLVITRWYVKTIWTEEDE